MVQMKIVPLEPLSGPAPDRPIPLPPGWPRPKAR
jgi:hypothetical protein